MDRGRGRRRGRESAWYRSLASPVDGSAGCLADGLPCALWPSRGAGERAEQDNRSVCVLLNVIIVLHAVVALAAVPAATNELAS